LTTLTDEELERMIIERFIRLGFAAKLVISVGSAALNAAEP